MNTLEINAFIDNDSLLIKKIYYEHREVFLSFGKKFDLPRVELEDIYQNAFVILRKQALKGKLQTVNSSLRTYLFGIGKHLIYKELKQQQRMLPVNPDILQDTSIQEEALDMESSLTVEQQLLLKNFKKLGKKCQNVLTLFYYRGLSIKEIVQMSNYSSENVVKSQKSRCLKTLKGLINFK